MWTALLLLAQGVALPALRAADLDAWREHVRPPAPAAAIEWIDNFADGVVASDRERKPLLFWAMNGHPLGCT